MHFIFSLHNACDVGVSQENLLAKKKAKKTLQQRRDGNLLCLLCKDCLKM